MKRVLTTALALMSFALTAQAAEQQTKIAVGELTCSSCAYIVSSAMKQVPTVQISTFTQDEKNWWEGVFVVTYDDASATPEMIAEAVMDYGYPASVVAEGGS